MQFSTFLILHGNIPYPSETFTVSFHNICGWVPTIPAITAIFKKILMLHKTIFFNGYFDIIQIALIINTSFFP